jgi:hypothetical protein
LLLSTPLRNGEIIIIQRKLTNKWFLVVLISLIGLWGVIDSYIYLKGDLFRLHGPIDGANKFCGISEGYENFRYLYFTDI